MLLSLRDNEVIKRLNKVQEITKKWSKFWSIAADKKKLFEGLRTKKGLISGVLWLLKKKRKKYWTCITKKEKELLQSVINTLAVI